MRMALNQPDDREEAILSVPEDRKVRTFQNEVFADYSTRKREYEEMVFPLKIVFDPDDWRMEFEEYWDYDKDKILLWNAFNSSRT